jgi:hypothetical protein
MSRRKPDDEIFLASLNKNAEPGQKYYIFNPNEEMGGSNVSENEILYKNSKILIYKMTEPK